jgi:ketosteroid isomerase-like protein
MKQLLTILGSFIITCFFIACNSNTANEASTNTSAETKSSFDLDAAKKSIDSTNAEFASLVAKGDSVGIANLYCSDAKMLGQSMPMVSGKAAIQSAFGQMLKGVRGAKLTSSEVYGSGDILSEVGTYSLTDNGGKEIDKGKYIVLWKMEDGKWKFFRDCFNSDLPPMMPSK